MGLRIDISSASLLLGIAVGVGATLAGGHYLPRTMQPAPTVAIAGLYHGVDETGTQALCDAQGRAYEVTVENGVNRRLVSQPDDPDGHPMPTRDMRCKIAVTHAQGTDQAAGLLASGTIPSVAPFVLQLISGDNRKAFNFDGGVYPTRRLCEMYAMSAALRILAQHPDHLVNWRCSNAEKDDHEAPHSVRRGPDGALLLDQAQN
jgi:hypothetical protein